MKILNIYFIKVNYIKNYANFWLNIVKIEHKKGSSMFVNIKVIYFLQLILWIFFFVIPIVVAKKSKDSYSKGYFKAIFIAFLVFSAILALKDFYIDYVSNICNNANDVSTYKGATPNSCDIFYQKNLFYGVGWVVTLFFMTILEMIYSLLVFYYFIFKKGK